MYHDISLLYKHIKNKKIGSIQLNQNKKKKLFCLNIKFKDSTNFTFDYHLKSRIKKHLINITNFITEDDALKR